MAKLTMAKSKILLTRDLLFYPVLATFTIRNYLGIGEKNGFRLISGGIIHLYVLINIFELYLLFHDMSDFLLSSILLSPFDLFYLSVLHGCNRSSCFYVSLVISLCSQWIV
jgi:hypothetical protein